MEIQIDLIEFIFRLNFVYFGPGMFEHVYLDVCPFTTPYQNIKQFVREK